MWKWLVGIVIGLIVFGVGAYYFFMDYAADKVMDQVSTTLVANEEEVNKLLEDPEIKNYLEDGEEAPENLPFTTKEEAIKIVSKKYSVNEMVEMRDKVREGLTSKEKEEIYNDIQSKFTEEELQALKVVALKEMKKNQ
ncbi:hypothetical protein ABE41_017220 [Fictibacillus arsenicus]|uniref:Phenylalanyl-tRNA synthetase subunit beta n=1 Tax=Fictibacillus arsenicus TaxID=255247 RepID=A0A1B1Z8G0_9BACL|nr:hypothetical protein [Fictibacillus arsenicus]ANX13753.1 hypothetical protein ABE41_017220 [Fictibacillus arsenicus]